MGVDNGINPPNGGNYDIREEMNMRKWASLILTIVLCAVYMSGLANGWTVPNNHTSTPGETEGEAYTYYSTTAKLIEDLATRSGPSTSYTGCGYYSMKGKYVTVVARAYDNGGVLWVEVEFKYGGGYRRAWTGAKRLDLSAKQLASLPEINSLNFIGYGTLNKRVAPRFGPDSLFATYGDRDYYHGNRVAVIAMVNDYYMVESYHTDGKILRSWIPCECVNLDQ